MNRLREVLLQQYIGAIAIGFLIVNAVTYVAISVAQVLSWVFLRHSESVIQPMGFNWGPLVSSGTHLALYLLAIYLLIQWLYRPRTRSVDPVPAEATEPDHAD
jgi:hypothetical protein